MIGNRTFYAQAAAIVQAGWCQRSFKEGDCVCFVQAIATALGTTPDKIPNSVINELFLAINGRDFANSTINEKRGRIFGWHDHIERTVEQVVALLNRLAEGPPEPQAPPRRKRVIRRRKTPTQARQLLGTS